jgi:peptidoglycan-associated lipoprotein
MKNFPERVVRIEGHADERGSIDYNMSLGEKRADEVKKRLLQAGIDSKRVKIVSYGEERPVDPGSNESAWFKNRRAEFKRVN